MRPTARGGRIVPRSIPVPLTHRSTRRGYDFVRRRGRRIRPLLPLTIALLTATAGVSQAVFVESAVSVAGSFNTTTLAPPTGVTAAVTPTGTVNLAWSATSSTVATGHRVLRASSSIGPFAQIGQIPNRTTTTYADAPGPGTFHYVVRSYYAVNGADWFSVNSNVAVATVANQPYVFKGSLPGSTANCMSAQRQREMAQGFTPTDPEETHARTAGAGTITFCSPTYSSGQVLSAGTTTVSAYFRNTSGSTCTITATLYLNGTSSLGSGSIVIPAYSTLSLRTWSFSTTAATLGSGSRLNLHISWGAVKACDTTYLHYDGATTNSRVLVPPVSAPSTGWVSPTPATASRAAGVA